MTRINDQIKIDSRFQEPIVHTVNLLALRVNQLERLLDGKELSEAKVEAGNVMYRSVKLSLNNGINRANWIEATIDSLPDTTGKTKYMVLQITSDTTVPPTAGWDWTRWV